MTIKRFVQWWQFINDGSGSVAAVELEYTSNTDGKLKGAGEKSTIDADTVFTVIGQTMPKELLEPGLIEMEHNQIVVNQDRKTRHAKIYAGGDCISGEGLNRG